MVLGVLQGLSEFLPISSSGHLVIAEHFLKFNQGGLAFEVFVHFGSLLAVIWIFRGDLRHLISALPFIFSWRSSRLTPDQRQYARLDLFLLIGSLPAAFIGIGFESVIERMFDSHVLAMGMLFITGLIVWSSRYTRESEKPMNARQAILIGVAQAVAILPGISRSGSTIVTGLWLGVPRHLAARFSFLLSIPVILGASLFKLTDIISRPLPSEEMTNILVASIAAAVSGYFAIIWLLAVIRKQKLEWFGIYCMVVSILGLIIDSVYP